MRLAKKLAFLSLFISLVLILIGVDFNITGNFINNYFIGRFSILHFIGLFLFVSSLIVLISKKSIDYLLIPDGSEKLREQRDYRVMEELIKRHGDVGEIYLMDGKDSEEDILYLGKKLKGGEKIGFVTFPLHYQEYKTLIKKAQKQGKFPKNVNIEPINTKQTSKQFIYGIMGLIEEKLKNRKMDFVESRNEKYLPKIKEFIKKIIRL